MGPHQVKATHGFFRIPERFNSDVSVAIINLKSLLYPGTIDALVKILIMPHMVKKFQFYTNRKASRMKTVFSFLFAVCLMFILPNGVYAQTLPPSQSAGGVHAQETQQERDQQLEQQIQSKKQSIRGAIGKKESPIVEEGQKSLVKEIIVKGVTLVPQEVIDQITKEYEGKELSINDMQKVCDLITDEYRKRGRVTSRAYMPPQTIVSKDSSLLIIVIEGTVGSIEVKGNKHFSAQLIKRKLYMKPGQYFDYPALQKALLKLNDHPDRFVKAGLIPGKEPGTTDIVLEVQDRLPIHFEYEIDNFGSRYMNYLRNTFTIEDNNLTGLDDKLVFRYQRSLGQLYSSEYISYTVPLSTKLQGGAYWIWNNTRLGKEYKSFDVKGRSSIGGPFFTYELINQDAVSLKLTGGVDFKSITNSVGGVQTSRDEDRVVKAGFNLDTSDDFGRTIITMEEDVAVFSLAVVYMPKIRLPHGLAQAVSSRN
jgi:hemolysin activation/secretion protein